MPVSYSIRTSRPEDYDRIEPVLDEWWGQHMTGLPRFFLDHFYPTSFTAEIDGDLVGFMVGFMSPGRPSVAYAHYIGVRPDLRRSGIGRDLYTRFRALAKSNGRTEVWWVTRESNTDSLAFSHWLGAVIQTPVNGVIHIHDIL